MPRFVINSDLSFTYPKDCNVTPKLKGQGFSLGFPDLEKDRESYYFKWINTKTPIHAWDFMQSSIFDKKHDLQPLDKDKKVGGFNLKKLPDLYKINLSHGEYVSFRGSEYDKDYYGIEWIEITWCRMYCHQVDGKPRILSAGFTAAGEGIAVTTRLRASFMNMINGVIYRPDDVDSWTRIQFPRKNRPSNRPSKKPATPVSDTTVPVITPVPDSPALDSVHSYKTRQCYACSGSGDQICNSCGGSGGRNESFTSYDWEGNIQYEDRWIPCSCRYGYLSCNRCGGSGYLTE